MERQKYDYSRYRHSREETYWMQRKGNEDIDFDGFCNEARFHPEDKGFFIRVDESHEPFLMEELYQEVGRDAPELEELVLEDEEDNPEDARILRGFSELFTIDVEFRNDIYFSENPRLNNLFSGANIIVPLGEGILDFCYTDFLGSIMKIEPFYKRFTDKYMKAARAVKMRKNPGEALPERDESYSQERIRNSAEETIRVYERFAEGMVMLRDILYRSLYTAIFPPVLLARTMRAFEHYTNYILLLQKEFLELIEFCYDEDFFPEVLGELQPFERYDLYCRIQGGSGICERTERFDANSLVISKTKMPFGMKDEEISERMGRGVNITDAHREFAEKYKLSLDELTDKYHMLSFVSTSYLCRNVHEMLHLEFTKMLEQQDVRFKKCRRCGMHFVVKATTGRSIATAFWMGKRAPASSSPPTNGTGRRSTATRRGKHITNITNATSPGRRSARSGRPYSNSGSTRRWLSATPARTET